MKKILLFVVLFVLAVGTYAQGGYQDVVYLKNGSIIRGTIIEQVPNLSIKIETADKNVFVYKMDEIEKIAKESPVRGSTSRSHGYDVGAYNIVNVGYAFGVGELKIDRILLDAVGAYRFNPYFSAGIGTGFRFYHDIELWMMPIYADFRAHLVDSKVAPFIAIKAGYSFDLSDNFKSGGLILNPSFGVEFKSTSTTTTWFSIGYEMQKIDVLWWDGLISKENMGAVAITIGLNF